MKVLALPRYKLSKWLLNLANWAHGYTTPQWPAYGEIDNINLIELNYLKAHDPEKPLKQIWEGWIDITDDNAEEMAELINKDLNRD